MKDIQKMFYKENNGKRNVKICGCSWLLFGVFLFVGFVCVCVYACKNIEHTEVVLHCALRWQWILKQNISWDMLQQIWGKQNVWWLWQTTAAVCLFYTSCRVHSALEILMVNMLLEQHGRWRNILQNFVYTSPRTAKTPILSSPNISVFCLLK